MNFKITVRTREDDVLNIKLITAVLNSITGRTGHSNWNEHIYSSRATLHSNGNLKAKQNSKKSQLTDPETSWSCWLATRDRVELLLALPRPPPLLLTLPETAWFTFTKPLDLTEILFGNVTLSLSTLLALFLLSNATSRLFPKVRFWCCITAASEERLISLTSSLFVTLRSAFSRRINSSSLVRVWRRARERL